jgi:uncharacterized protein YdaU (DUF1376 family)
MSRLDEDLASLRLKLAALEEQKRVETEAEAEKRANPMKRLETNLTQTRQSIEYHSRHKRWTEAMHARGRVADLESILEMLTQIQTRVDVLERASTPIR